jgi:hypothetical protein
MSNTTSEILNELPKEIQATILSYLIQPTTSFDVDVIAVSESPTQLEAVIINLIISTIYTNVCDLNGEMYTHTHTTTIKHNINFMDVEKDISKLDDFIECLRENKFCRLHWDSPRFSPTHFNIIEYEPAHKSLTCEIYQMGYEQYFAPSPALSYTVDKAFGKFKTSSHVVCMTDKSMTSLIDSLLSIKKLVQRYG